MKHTIIAQHWIILPSYTDNMMTHTINLQDNIESIDLIQILATQEIEIITALDYVLNKKLSNKRIKILLNNLLCNLENNDYMLEAIVPYNSNLYDEQSNDNSTIKSFTKYKGKY